MFWAGTTPPGEVHGRWSVLADSTAAGSAALWNSNAGQAKVTPALASPATYFERTFDATAGIPYVGARSARQRHHDPAGAAAATGAPLEIPAGTGWPA